ncbi:MAG: cytochrome b N-terminal domain-containing protein [Anaerolineales bacterium]|nr:cytochrome b N-terminal domain-containing protein [Anaerolineales bacterium]
MTETDPENQNPSLLRRIRARLVPDAHPADDRGRMRMVLDSLILHLHPPKVPDRTLKWTYTWGLGGLSAVLMLILGATGAILLNNYTPSAPQAYLDILELRSNVWFGELVRNLHHWSANLLVIIAVLHLLRVFLTGSYRAPRELNWLIGVGMLLLVLAANFTGYLLPWDQLAYWAITVGTGILSYIPLVGEWLSRLVLGGPEVGASTLLNFYSLHISFIPLLIFGLMSFHFWRVRKDGGLTLPRRIDETEEPRVERLTTIPHLVRKELVFALVWIAAILIFAMLVPAPLEDIANPGLSPNPAKAPWYFLGLQELLLHFHPLVAGIILPGLAMLGIFLLPFIDINTASVGIYFRSRRGRSLSLLALGLAILLTPLWVLLDEFILDWSAWLPSWPSLITNGLIPMTVVLLPLILIDDWAQKHLRADLEERILFLVIFLFTAFGILTAIGIFFRGPGMNLYWPWLMPEVVH